MPPDHARTLRTLRRSWRFSLAVVFSLGIAIGASTTVFSWMEGLVLRPLPAVAALEGLVSIRPDSVTGPPAISYPEYSDWRERARTVSGVVSGRGLDPG